MRYNRALAPLGVALLLLSALPISAAAQGSGSGGLTVTVNPDGSLSVAVQITNTTTAPPGTAPNIQFSASVATSNGQSVATEHLTATVPSADLSKLNLTGSVSGQGSYADGQAHGTITFNGAPGVGNPATSLTLTYNGTSSALTASGSVEATYGTYVESGQSVEVNQTTVSDMVALYQSQLNVSSLNAALATDPALSGANLTVTSFSISPTYGTSSATVDVNMGISGNFTALPGAELAAYCKQNSTSSCTADAALTDALDSAVTSYTYSFGYSAGSVTFDATVTGPTNFNLGAIMRAEANSPQSSNLTAAQRSFLNTTTIDITGLTASGSVSQASSGVVTTQFSMSGLTLRPTVTITNGGFDESGFFGALGTAPANITIKTSGGVGFTLPSGVPTPTSQTSNSASWTNVSGQSLSPMAFSGGSATTTTSPGQSTTGTGGIPEFPLQAAGLTVLTAAVLVGYLLARRTVLPKIGRV